MILLILTEGQTDNSRIILNLSNQDIPTGIHVVLQQSVQTLTFQLLFTNEDSSPSYLLVIPAVQTGLDAISRLAHVNSLIIP